PETVLDVRVEPCLLQELCSLQVIETATERLLWQLSDRLQQNERHVLANNRGNLQEPLVLGRETVNARGQDGLHRTGDLDGVNGWGEVVAAAFAYQHLRLHQRSHRLLEEERVSALNEKIPQRCKPRFIAEQRIEEIARALGGQRVQSYLAVSRLAAPGMLVPGAVVHKQQQACGTQALH